MIETIVVTSLILFIGFFLFKVLLGMLLPINKTANALLGQNLKKFEINHLNIPSNLRVEIVDLSIQLAELRCLSNPSKSAIRREVVEQINFVSVHLSNYIKKPDMEFGSEDPYVQIYKKYTLTHL